MSRWIDAEWLKKHTKIISYTGMWRETETDEFVSRETMEDAPSIDIVRCEDCLKHKVVPFGENACFYWCDLRGHAINPDDFCSYGEVRDE